MKPKVRRQLGRSIVWVFISFILVFISDQSSVGLGRKPLYQYHISRLRSTVPVSLFSVYE